MGGGWEGVGCPTETPLLEAKNWKKKKHEGPAVEVTYSTPRSVGCLKYVEPFWMCGRKGNMTHGLSSFPLLFSLLCLLFLFGCLFFWWGGYGCGKKRPLYAKV